MTDVELLNLYLQRGDDEAFTQLVRRHAGWVHGMARRRVRDGATADDVTQAVFILLHRKRPRLPNDRALVSWLHRAAWYASEVALRSQRRRTKHEAEAAMIRDVTRENAADREMWEQLAPLLDEMVGRLRRADREAILLRYYRQMSFAELGKSLEISEEAARKRVDRAIEKLRAMAARKGVTEAAAAGSIAGVMDHQMTSSAPAGVVASAAGAALAMKSGVAGSSIPIAKGAMNMMVWAKAKVAASVMVAGTIVVGGAAMVIAGQPGATSRPATTTKSVPWQDFPKLSPFAAVKFVEDGTAQVKVDDDTWVQWVAIDDVTAAEIVAFAKERYGQRWEKRVVEDLVEVMDNMKKPVAVRVKLTLKDLGTGEQKELRDVLMSHEKRQKLWEARNAETESPASGPAKL